MASASGGRRRRFSGLRWNRDGEPRAALGEVGDVDAAAVHLDDRTADREAHAKAVPFGREKRLEDPRRAPSSTPGRRRLPAWPHHRCRGAWPPGRTSAGDACPRVACTALLTRFMATCCNCTQSPRTAGGAGWRSATSRTPSLAAGGRRPHDVAADDRVQMELQIEGLLAEHPADAGEHVDGAAIPLDDVIEDPADFPRFGDGGDQGA